nr:helix-turn-helix domain-containing protein [uncultured Bilophila sp.]
MNFFLISIIPDEGDRSNPFEHDGFSGILARMHSAAEVRTQEELADFFGIGQEGVSDAARRMNVPSDCLLIALLSKNISPEWILTGNGPRLMTPAPDRYETAWEFQERREAELAVRRLPSRILAEELLRRIAIAQLT